MQPAFQSLVTDKWLHAQIILTPTEQGLSLDDLLIVIATDITHLPLVKATRVLRKVCGLLRMHVVQHISCLKLVYRPSRIAIPMNFGVQPSAMHVHSQVWACTDLCK